MAHGTRYESGGAGSGSQYKKIFVLYTEMGLSLGTWFGEICFCPFLASRNKFHQTTYQDFSRPLC